MRAAPIGRDDRRAVLSVVIIGSPAREIVATMRFGEVAMPVCIAEIESRPFRERPRDRGIAIDPRGEDRTCTSCGGAEEASRCPLSLYYRRCGHRRSHESRRMRSVDVHIDGS